MWCTWIIVNVSFLNLSLNQDEVKNNESHRKCGSTKLEMHHANSLRIPKLHSIVYHRRDTFKHVLCQEKIQCYLFDSA